MKIFQSRATLNAVLAFAASLVISTAAIGAIEPAKAAAKTPAALDENAIVKLNAKQKLPKIVKQLTIIDRDTGDKNAKPVTSDNAVQVHYSGWLYDPTKPDGKGEIFDSSWSRQLPYGFFLGAGKVIKGWERGIVGMNPKGKRTLIIPPSLAYGDKEQPKIPANSTLIFDVELLDIIGTRDKTPATAQTSAPAASVGTASGGATAATAQPATPPPPVSPPKRISPQDPLPAAPTELTMIDQVIGDGADAINGTTVTVHYTGWLYDPAQPEGKGRKFDSSVSANRPFKFPLGGGRVIKGWDQGVLGMKVKGKRTLIIPSEFGYGARGAGGLIPPNSTLIFDVELLEVPPAQ